MLVGHDVVLVLRVDGLVVRRHVDVVGGEAVLGEGLEEVGVARAVQVEGGEVGVFVLGLACACVSLYQGRFGLVFGEKGGGGRCCLMLSDDGRLEVRGRAKAELTMADVGVRPMHSSISLVDSISGGQVRSRAA